MYGNYDYYPDYLMHYGVKGMKWGHRKSRAELEKQAGTFTASNGMKVAPSKNAYVRIMRKVAANRGVEKVSSDSYRNTVKKRNADTLTNREHTVKGEKQIRKESQALREYNAHIKDLKKGDGTKHLDKAVRKNKIDDAFEKVQTSSTRLNRAIFSDGTRKKAAKYMVDNNMSMKEAKKKANSEAIRNTAILLAAYGTIGAVSYKAGYRSVVKN